ncbi:hypothetical protein OG618_27420 [Kitasatospora sp. NBC_01246]|uniref:hypothetical protein n=1 Tax=Kitasatospora sp. NBC_01246 TaxID=2903570 RepID=UPI002E35A06B|nr:hypothetical protein [Kitasatospora sp. NBC_01246]
MTAVASLLDAEAPHPRAAVFLLRRALEGGLETYISAHRSALSRCRTETKVVWLAHNLDHRLAGRLAAVWRNLSVACHHQQFALPPTVGELLGWRDEVAFVLRALRT